MRITFTYADIYTDSYTNRYVHSYAKSDVYSYSVTNCYADSYVTYQCYPNSDVNTYVDPYTNPMYRQMFTDAEVSTYASTAPIASGNETETQCSICFLQSARFDRAPYGPNWCCSGAVGLWYIRRTGRKHYASAAALHYC